MSRLFSCFLIFHSCFFSFAPSCHPPSVHTYSDIPSCSFSPSFSFTVSFWSFFIISASPLLFHTAWLLSLFFLFSLWPSFIFTYSLFLPPLLLCKVVAVCLKSGLIELRSGESTATSILHTHTEIHAHTDTNTSSFSLCSSINAVSPTGTEVDAHIHTLLSHQLRVCIDLSLQQWCLFGFYIVFCSSSYISVYDPNTHTNTATHAQTHTARYTHRYTHLCNIISFVVSENFL